MLDDYTRRVLPIPPQVRPDLVGEVWRVPYEERAVQAEAWSAEHGLRAAHEDAAWADRSTSDARRPVW